MNSHSKRPWTDLYLENKEEAWKSFLENYHDLIIRAIKKLVKDHDEAMEVYSFAIDKLKEGDCKKLAGYYAKTRDYDFETWIVVVVRNCCFDWLRKEKGRKRLLKVIEDLPDIDQWIFRYFYWHHYSYDTIFELLRNEHGFQGSFEAMCNRIDQLNETLQSKTKWKLTQDWLATLPLLSLNEADDATGSPSHDDHSPEKELIQSDTSQVIEEILDSLPTHEQLVIQFHFYHNLTLEEIARILKMKNIWRVRRKLATALKLLKKKFKEEGITSSDFNI